MGRVCLSKGKLDSVHEVVARVVTAVLAIVAAVLRSVWVVRWWWRKASRAPRRSVGVRQERGRWTWLRRGVIRSWLTQQSRLRRRIGPIAMMYRGRGSGTLDASGSVPLTAGCFLGLRAGPLATLAGGSRWLTSLLRGSFGCLHGGLLSSQMIVTLALVAGENIAASVERQRGQS